VGVFRLRERVFFFPNYFFPFIRDNNNNIHPFTILLPFVVHSSEATEREREKGQGERENEREGDKTRLRCVLTNKKDSCSFYFLSEKPLFVLQAYACYGGLRQKRAMFIKEEIAAEASTWEKVERPVPLLYFLKKFLKKSSYEKNQKKASLPFAFEPAKTKDNEGLNILLLPFCSREE